MIRKPRKILFVDDSPHRWEHFNAMFNTPENGHVLLLWAKNYDEAVAALRKHSFAVVFLDHDLEDPGDWDAKVGWRDGTAIVDWIREHTPDIGFTVCHSMNPVGRQRMCMTLGNGGYAARPVPFYAFDSMVETLNDLIAHGQTHEMDKTRVESDDSEDRINYGG